MAPFPATDQQGTADGHEAEVRQLSQAAGLAMAAAALCGGALLAGSVHFMSTAKQLAAEGVDPAARVRAVPLGMKALLISTAVTAAAGASVLLGIRSAGVDAHSVATLSSWETAVLVAQQQRDAVRLEFQKRLHPDSGLQRGESVEKRA